MPIVCGTKWLGTNTLGSTTYTSTIGGYVAYDNSEISHGPTFATSTDNDSPSTSPDAPSLMAYCTSSAKCIEPWTSAGSQLVTISPIVPTVQARLSPSETSSITTIGTAGAIPSVVTSLVLDRYTFDTARPVTTPLARLILQNDFIARDYMEHSLDPNSIDAGTTPLSTNLAIAIWQQENLKSLPPDWTVSLVKRIGAVLPANTDGTSRENNAVGSGLSTGAKAGIGIGVAIGALAVTVTFVLLFLRRRRRAKSQLAIQEHGTSGDGRPGSRPYQEELVDWREVVEGGRLPR